MTMIAKTVLSLAGLVVIGSAVLLWAQFGKVIIFDIASASFIGCL